MLGELELMLVRRPLDRCPDFKLVGGLEDSGERLKRSLSRSLCLSVSGSFFLLSLRWSLPLSGEEGGDTAFRNPEFSFLTEASSILKLWLSFSISLFSVCSLLFACSRAFMRALCSSSVLRSLPISTSASRTLAFQASISWTVFCKVDCNAPLLYSSVYWLPDEAEEPPVVEAREDPLRLTSSNRTPLVVVRLWSGMLMLSEVQSARLLVE